MSSAKPAHYALGARAPQLSMQRHGGGEPQAAKLVLVTPDGEARVVAEDLKFPNGSVITPDGATLIIGETMGHRLTAFSI